MKKAFEISYEWWGLDGEEIKESHKGALEETAEEHIIKMMEEGYTSGELLDNIIMDDEDGEDGVAYSGWWTKKIINL